MLKPDLIKKENKNLHSAFKNESRTKIKTFIGQGVVKMPSGAATQTKRHKIKSVQEFL